LKGLLLTFLLIGILFSGSIFIPTVYAQYQSGGVNHPGKWYVGEGLKPGDFFSYKLCHVDYKDCSEFQIDLWIEGTITVGTEDKWLAQVVVYDGNKIVKGNMELGKIAPEPSGGSPELGVYRGAFKSSVVWLSAYATKNINESDKGEKSFSAPSWGKIANIGGEQIIPTALEKVTVPAGTYDTVRIQFKTGGAISKVWVVDDFPFPIKASTWTQVSEGIPPQEYRFQLLDYKQYVNSDPFVGIKSTPIGEGVAEGCTKNYNLVDVKKTTKNFKYLIELRYGPPDPASGCEIEWFINFKKPADETEYLNQVQYDIFVVDDKLTLPPLRSIANEEGRNFLYSQAGQVHTKTIVKENSGTAHYVIWVYGLAPQSVVTGTTPDFLQIDIPIGGKVTPPPPPGTSLDIPSWIKNNAGWWANDQIGDSDFVSGIQFLINQGIMKIPATTPGSGTGSDQIPSWIKNNAGWWANNQISDKDFVSGIQFLIENGIMKIA
jgi:hypothetical protein